MPANVVCLESPDEFLRIRIMNLPENVVTGTHNTEEGLMRRLTDYRTINTEDETVLNYFDELEIHPEKIGAYWLLELNVHNIEHIIINNLILLCIPNYP